jgi:hypothetical protein
MRFRSTLENEYSSEATCRDSEQEQSDTTYQRNHDDTAPDPFMRSAATIKSTAPSPLAAKQVPYISRSNVFGTPFLAKVAINAAAQIMNADTKP